MNDLFWEIFNVNIKKYKLFKMLLNLLFILTIILVVVNHLLPQNAQEVKYIMWGADTICVAVYMLLNRYVNNKYLNLAKNVENMTKTTKELYEIYETEEMTSRREVLDGFMWGIFALGAVTLMLLMIFSVFLKYAMPHLSEISFICIILVSTFLYIIYKIKFECVKRRRMFNVLILNEDKYLKICEEREVSTEKYYIIKAKYLKERKR